MMLNPTLKLLLLSLALPAHAAEDKPTVTEARCIPQLENGKQIGFRCFQILEGSFYDQLGMKDGDVLTELNGHPATDPSVMVREIGKMRESHAKKTTYKFMRDGKEITKSYDPPKGVAASKPARKQYTRRLKPKKSDSVTQQVKK